VAKRHECVRPPEGTPGWRGARPWRS
jgi:hypothetical protein